MGGALLSDIIIAHTRNPCVASSTRASLCVYTQLVLFKSIYPLQVDT